MTTHAVATDRFLKGLCPNEKCDATLEQSVRQGSRVYYMKGGVKRTVVFYKCAKCKQTYHVHKSIVSEVSFSKFGREHQTKAICHHSKKKKGTSFKRKKMRRIG